MYDPPALIPAPKNPREPDVDDLPRVWACLYLEASQGGESNERTALAGLSGLGACH